MLKLDDRLVVDYAVEGDLNDAVFTEAYFDDTGDALTDSELDALGEQHGDVLYDNIYQKLVGIAEAYHEGDR